MEKLFNKLITQYIKRHPETFDSSKKSIEETEFSKEDLKIVDLSDYVLVSYGVWKSVDKDTMHFTTFDSRIAKQLSPKERNAHIKKSGLSIGWGWLSGNNRSAPFYKLINGGIIVPYLDPSYYETENVICINYVKPAVSCFKAKTLVELGTKLTFSELKQLDNLLSESYRSNEKKADRPNFEKESDTKSL